MSGYKSLSNNNNKDSLLLFEQDSQDPFDSPSTSPVRNKNGQSSGNLDSIHSGGQGSANGNIHSKGLGFESINIPTSDQGMIGNLNENAEGTMDLNTLDEPVIDTIKRDLLSIWAKVRQVFFPAYSSISTSDSAHHILRDWDLWGPLLLCLILSIRLSITAPDGQAPRVFTTVFAVVWIGSAVITINSKLLGGKLSFFQSVCVIGYCLFPLALCSIITLFVPFIVRVILISVGFVWAVWSSVGFIGEAKLNERRLLAVYPISLFYFAISWIILVSKGL